jgi:hypothetical protein
MSIEVIPKFPQFSFSANDLDLEGACNLEDRLEDLHTTLNDVPDDEQIDIDVWFKLNTTSTRDMLWTIRLDKENWRDAAKILAQYMRTVGATSCSPDELNQYVICVDRRNTAGAASLDLVCMYTCAIVNKLEEERLRAFIFQMYGISP